MTQNLPDWMVGTFEKSSARVDEAVCENAKYLEEHHHYKIFSAALTSPQGCREILRTDPEFFFEALYVADARCCAEKLCFLQMLTIWKTLKEQSELSLQTLYTLTAVTGEAQNAIRLAQVEKRLNPNILKIMSKAIVKLENTVHKSCKAQGPGFWIFKKQGRELDAMLKDFQTTFLSVGPSKPAILLKRLNLGKDAKPVCLKTKPQQELLLELKTALTVLFCLEQSVMCIRLAPEHRAHFQSNGKPVIPDDTLLEKLAFEDSGLFAAVFEDLHVSN